ncbi:Uncharacterised protein [Mycobacteroides abscessus subsp. abscessus]|nr:Uncharacterised protein [Mycobacteroides abscessus subsp. abscessus]
MIFDSDVRMPSSSTSSNTSVPPNIRFCRLVETADRLSPRTRRSVTRVPPVAVGSRS